MCKSTASKIQWRSYNNWVYGCYPCLLFHRVPCSLFFTRFASYWSSSNDDYAKINAYLKRRCSREMKKKKKRKNMNKRLINKFMNENKMCAIRRTRITWNENEIGMYAWIASEKRDRRIVWASECAWYREKERDWVVIKRKYTYTLRIITKKKYL